MAEHAIPAALRPYVRSVVSYDIDGMPPGEHIGLPSGSATLIVPLEPLSVSTAGRPVHSYRGLLGGLHHEPVTIQHAGSQHGLHICLHPLGVRRLFGVPVGELESAPVELADLIGDVGSDRLLDQVTSAPGWPERAAIVLELIAGRAESDDRSEVAASQVRSAWHLLQATDGRMRIDRVAAEVGWSTRHLAKQFAASIGHGPKTAARILRFENSVRCLRAGVGAADTAARCGYADQAHLVREWRRMAGTTPSRWPVDDVIANVQDHRPRAHR